MRGVLAIDQGTTSTKAWIVRGRRIAARLPAVPTRQHHPGPGRVEQDAVQLLTSVRTMIAAAGPDIAAIGIANQGETCLAWDRDDGRPIHPAISWQDARTSDRIDGLVRDGGDRLSTRVAGVPLDTYFSASKLGWLMSEIDEAERLRAKGRLGLGTTDAYLIERLTRRYATDASTASRTGLMDLRRVEWSEELCELHGVPVDTLPRIVPTCGEIGEVGTARLTASLVDQQAALVGLGRSATGDAKMTFGTGAFALAIAGTCPPARGDAKVSSTIAWRIEQEPAVYAVEGGVYAAGAAVDWARRVVSATDAPACEGPLAIERGLVFVPALVGLACPHWRRDAAGLWIGLTPATTGTDLLRAVVEGVALRAGEVLREIGRAVGGLKEIAIDGGLVGDAYLRHVLARIVDVNLAVSTEADATLVGIAAHAQRGAGFAETLAPPLSHRIPPSAPLPEEAWRRFAQAVECGQGWWR